MSLSDKILAYYRLDGNANDSIGTRHGVAFGVTYAPGVAGQCGIFDGMAEIAVSAFGVDFGGALSVSFQFKVSVQPGSGAYYTMATYTGAVEIMIDGNGYLAFFVMGADGSSVKFYGVETDFADNAWHQAGFVFDAGTLSIMADGAFVTPTVMMDMPFTAIYYEADQHFKLGCGSLVGSLDDIVISDQVLSEAEMASLYTDPGLPSPVWVRQGVALHVGEVYVRQHQRLLLSRGDYTPGFLAAWAGLPDEATVNQGIWTPLGENTVHFLLSGFGADQVQAIITSSGEDACQALLHGLGTGRDHQLFVGFPVAVSQAIQNRVGWFLHVVQKQLHLLSRGDYVPGTQKIVAGLPDEARGNQSTINSLSEAITTAQGVLNLLSRGDHTPGAQKNLAGLPDEARGNQSAINSLSEAITTAQGVLNLLSRGDNTPGAQKNLAGLPDEARGNQSAINSLSEAITTAQGVLGLLSRGDYVPGTQKNLAGLPDEARHIQVIKNQISTSVQVAVKQLLTLSADPVRGFHQLLQTIAEKNDIYGMQKLSLAVSETAMRYFSTPFEIYLDGRPLSGRFVTAEILYDENTVHNSLNLTSADPQLFAWADPAIQPGEPRIEVHVGTRLMYFIILPDGLTGEASDFKLTALSVSIREDSDFAENLEFTLPAPELASEIAAGLTEYCPIDWQAHDWIVPATFSFSGPPLDGIQRLAEAVGAVVRCQDDGSLLVRPRRPVRPVDMPSTPAAVDYDNDIVIALNHAMEAGSGCNAVEVLGAAGDTFIPILKLEEVEDGPYIGQTVYVRVYWAGNPVRVSDTYATDGDISVIGNGVFYTQEEEETIEFLNGTASVNLPVDELMGVEWIGDSGGEISYTRDQSELVIADSAFRVATVRYRTRYQRYQVSGHDVERLIAVLFLTPGNEVDVLIQTPEDPVWAAPITDELLTDAAAAVARGTAYIDANKYSKSTLTIEAPYVDAAVDGAVCHITDSEIQHPGNHHIVSSKISVDGPKVINILGVEKCLIS